MTHVIREGGLRVVPDVAAGNPRISPDGRVYTFTLRRGFRFSNGATLDARAFEHEIERVRELDSKALPEIAGVAAKGRTLTIRLTRPLADFTARLTLPVFCAVPPELPADPEGVKVFPSAGPYYVSEFVRGSRVVLRKNPYYGGNRPHHVSRIDVALTADDVVAQVERGVADWAPIEPGGFASRARELQKYIRSGRLSFRPSQRLQFLVLNTARPLFRGNARLRRAVNFAVDRLRVAALRGPRVVRPTDQYLPIGFPGFQPARIYPFTPRLQRARALARGHLRAGKAVLYVPMGETSVALAQVVKANLAKIRLGVTIKPIPNYFTRLATRGEPFDIALAGWIADWNDPSTFIDELFHGRNIGRANWSNFNSRKYNRMIDQASRLYGAKRYRAYAKLEHQLAHDAAPIVALNVPNQPTLVSARVDPRCKILNPGLDLAAVCLKR